MSLVVADNEDLARYCDRQHVKKNGSVKPRAFICTKFPAELSVDRLSICGMDKSAERAVQETVVFGHSRTFVMLVTGRVRSEVPDAEVHAKPLSEPVDAPEHAEIHLKYEGGPYETADELRNAQLFARHVERCDKLAEISRARDCDKPSMN